MPLSTHDISPAELCATRFRQIHLDFHTSPLIPDVGTEFNAEEFAAVLEDARVNWVTLFGKCHHGMSYYPTAVGTMHPGLDFDLLGQQIEACRKRGIVTPVYISVRVDNHMGTLHPEWVGLLKDNRLWGPGPMDAGWYNLCMNNPDYVDYLEAQAIEVLKTYDPEGLFFDMCYTAPDPGCFCPRCIARLEAAGYDRADDDAHRRMEFEITREYTQRLARVARDIRPNTTLFFNSRVTPNVRQELDVLTHLEVESLPTAGHWSYFYFPFMARAVRTTGWPVQGMTARFHGHWGDFGGLKTVPQIEYEAGAILAAGAVMNTGDQLHPRGKLDRGVYQVIGEVYRQVEEKEPWCLHATPVVEAAVVMLPDRPGARLVSNPSVEGAGQMLQELKLQWNVETPDGDWSQYDLLVIPDRGLLEDDTRAKLAFYLGHGGSVILSHEATLDMDLREIRCPGVGVSYVERCEFTPSFMRPGEILGAGLPESDVALYGNGSLVEPDDGTESMGSVVSSYFNRDYHHFMSHIHSAQDRALPYPVGTRRGRVVYLYGQLFGSYRQSGSHAYKTIFANAVRLLMPLPLVQVEGPAAMEVTLNRQEAEKRTVVHLVNFQPQRRHGANEYIDYVWPARDIRLKVRALADPERVYLAPQRTDLPFVREGDTICFTVPEVRSHQMVAMDEGRS